MAVRDDDADRAPVLIVDDADLGKVAEIWNHRDNLGLMEQVGAAIYAGARDDE